MVIAVLSAVVIWFMFYGRLDPLPLALLCTGLGVALAVSGRHKHTRFILIDVLTQVSRLNRVNPMLKFCTILVLIFLSITSQSPLVGLILTLLSPVLVVGVGGLMLREYIRLLALPLAFLLLSGLALLFEVSAQHTGVLGFRVFGVWLCVNEATQIRTALVMARAFGAVSCLYMLNLTTPMMEIIGVLRRLRCPGVLSDLMYLIYRYIFILLSMHYSMKDAAQSRLGYVNYRTSLRTTAMLYSGLLSRSYRQAGINFDAMESRCYDTRILFLEREPKVTAFQAVCTTLIIVAIMGLTISLR